MADRPVENLTLREMFNNAERLSRELLEHLDHGFIPKAHHLMRLVRPTETESHASDVEDVTVRNHAANLLESEAYTEKLYQNLEAHCAAIEKTVSRIVTEGEA